MVNVLYAKRKFPEFGNSEINNYSALHEVLHSTFSGKLQRKEKCIFKMKTSKFKRTNV